MTALELPSWTNSTPGVYGSPIPRIFTPPLVTGDPGPCICGCALTPATSWGFDLIDFAEEIGWPLDPWEQWAAIHMGELKPNGDPRFRFVLILVARQNGKTTLCRVIVLYWMFIERHSLILGTSTTRDMAKVSWRETIEMAEGVDLLRDALEEPHTREVIGEEAFFNVYGSHYRFAAPNRRAGRSLTVRRLILDELREHKNWDAHDAAVNAMNAVPDAQTIAITNQGDSNSVVLDSIRGSAIEFMETGLGDPTLFIAEWSARNGADPTDLKALAAANPNLGHRIPVDALMGQAIRAKRAGGEQLARFRTEVLCQRVTLLDPAIDPDLWRECGTDDPLDLAEYRRSLVLAYDIALDGNHATLLAAVTIDDITHVEIVKRWIGFGASNAMKADLPELVERLRPRTVASLPKGPTAGVSVDLGRRKGRSPWPPRRVTLEEMSEQDAPAMCMSLEKLVEAGQIRHPRDEMLTAHVERTQKLRRGAEGLWTFTRAGDLPVDATYALGLSVWYSRRLTKLVPVTGA
jgi:hypothetical protein